ncbi:putative leucine-rich repeat-containing, plant-type, leucine-rich repeat domain superfamily [Helianthus annuus]|nr:putative leucine-rich repeat-containing, plant-type, leucine-rich repeat domain superfamily [Helianthus annuus]
MCIRFMFIVTNLFCPSVVYIMTSSTFSLLIFLHILLNPYLYLSAYSSSFPADTIACHPQQRLALLHFKQEFTISNDIYNDMQCKMQFGSTSAKTIYWNASIDCCLWDGVTCDQLTGDIVGLDLGCSKLQGTIDSNSSLFRIPRLRSLNLAYNDLGSSQIPPEIGRFASSLTYLNLSSSSFSGHVPSEILHLSKLVSLDLSYNHFDSIHPQFLSKLFKNVTRLRELSLKYVNISSTLPSNLSSSLTSLDLSGTHLLGDLPDDIFNLPNLQNLALSLNIALTGSLPKVNRSRNIPLRLLDLSQTGITGDIPASIVNFRSLESLNLYDCKLSGFLPRFVGNLSNLVTLDLKSTNVGGIIPSSITSLTQLVKLDLSDNSFTGLPASNNITGLQKLVHLDISRNLLEGVIPSWVSLLTSVEDIRLTTNMLSGVIPSGLFKLSSLEVLDLSYNKLQGTIPSVFALPSLRELMLDDNQLVGQLNLLDEDLVPPRSFLQLVNITYLTLANNNFSGVWDLDILLSSLTNLQGLDLSYSGLSVVTANANLSVNPEFYALKLASCKLNVFPEFLRSATKLSDLDLSHNDIHGQLPSWTGKMWMDSLSIFDLSHNFITGLYHLPWNYLLHLKLESNLIRGPFPLSICKMSFIQIVDLSNNHFNGTIPNCFGYINENLVMIDLGNNSFHGIFPVISGCERLGELNLNRNLLHGKLPRSLAKCAALEVLDVGNNQFNDVFPNWLETLPILKVLVLRSNSFHGSITNSEKTDFQFSNLRILDLSQNKFSGTLQSKFLNNLKAMMNVSDEKTEENYSKSPIGWNIYYHTTVVIKGMSYELVRILTTLTTIDLSDNIFEGSIPDIIGSLKSLKVLNFSHNSLTGHIPYALGNLSKIESLDLSWNQLVGEIPQQLTALTFLAVLNLSQNHLEGRIPRERQFNTFEDNSYLGNPELCGFPLPKECEKNHETDQSSIQTEDSQDTESGFTWQAVVLGYGTGTLLGLVMGYLMLSTGRPKWFNRIADAAEHIVHTRQNKRRSIYIAK